MCTPPSRTAAGTSTMTATNAATATARVTLFVTAIGAKTASRAGTSGTVSSRISSRLMSVSPSQPGHPGRGQRCRTDVADPHQHPEHDHRHEQVEQKRHLEDQRQAGRDYQ